MHNSIKRSDIPSSVYQKGQNRRKSTKSTKSTLKKTIGSGLRPKDAWRRARVPVISTAVVHQRFHAGILEVSERHRSRPLEISTGVISASSDRVFFFGSYGSGFLHHWIFSIQVIVRSGSISYPCIFSGKTLPLYKFPTAEAPKLLMIQFPIIYNPNSFATPPFIIHPHLTIYPTPQITFANV